MVLLYHVRERIASPIFTKLHAGGKKRFVQGKQTSLTGGQGRFGGKDGDNRSEGRFGGQNHQGGQRSGGARRSGGGSDAIFTPELTKTSKDSKRERDRENKNKKKDLDKK